MITRPASGGFLGFEEATMTPSTARDTEGEAVFELINENKTEWRVANRTAPLEAG
jgi:hypothetical protein